MDKDCVLSVAGNDYDNYNDNDYNSKNINFTIKDTNYMSLL